MWGFGVGSGLLSLCFVAWGFGFAVCTCPSRPPTARAAGVGGVVAKPKFE